MTNLLKSSWNNVDPAELMLVLRQRIGMPGQYYDRAKNPGDFYLPLAGDTCRLKLTFSDENKLIGIAPGPAFDSARWDEVVHEIESTGPTQIGRDCSFSSFRVAGAWRGAQSGVQILPPPTDAPVAPYEMAEHPFILEFPVKASNQWAITNYRRLRDHRRLTLLLNVLLAGRTCLQPRRLRHLWATVTDEPFSSVKWVQEFFFARIGEVIIDAHSPPTAEPMKSVDSNIYYTSVVNDGRCLEVPDDLDDLICCYTGLSANSRATFDRASFWMDMASRQWTISSSASFASLVIAIEALGDRAKRATRRFHDYLERYAPGATLQDRRSKMYALRSDILHGSGLIESGQDGDFGWGPPAQTGEDMIRELWGLTKLSMRNWLKSPP